jgi:hypothetical protein
MCSTDELARAARRASWVEEFQTKDVLGRADERKPRIKMQDPKGSGIGPGIGTACREA